MKNTNTLTFQNNFDLLRLFAALEVMFYHIFSHFKPPENIGIYNFIFSKIVHYFPGVPVFFMISGFLIYWSFERNSNAVQRFFQNRARRIFPALWVCTFITLFFLMSFNAITPENFAAPKLILWIVGQLSFFQFWTPDIFRSFGLGNPNGVLATITVELQFYLLIPLIFSWIGLRLKSHKNLFLISMALISYIFNQIAFNFLEHESVIFKLISVSIFPYLFYFILGILFYNNFESVKKIISEKFYLWFFVFLMYPKFDYFLLHKIILERTCGSKLSSVR